MSCYPLLISTIGGLMKSPFAKQANAEQQAKAFIDNSSVDEIVAIGDCGLPA